MTALLLWLTADLLAGAGFNPLATGKPVVLLFTRPDCPISNRYAPEVRRLYERYAPKGVRFYLVYSDKTSTEAAREKHGAEYGYPMPAVGDPRRELAAKAGVRVTPEAAVFLRGKLLYRGRIDDRYEDFGRARPTASKHDLDEVLAAVVAERPLPFAETKAVGCAIEDLR